MGKIKLLSHQVYALEQIKFKYRLGVFFDTGTGKTVIGLEAIKQKSVPTLIVTKKSLIDNAWIADAERFYPELAQKVTSWHKIKNKKLTAEVLPFVLIINYESISYENMKVFSKYYDMIILDESQAVKNPKAKITKILLKYHHTFAYLYLFSGTPAPNSELEYWSSLYLLNAIEDGFYKWKTTNFHKVDYRGFKLVINNSYKIKLQELLRQYTISIHKRDCLKLKEQKEIIVEFELDKKEKEAYKKMAKECLLEIEGNEITANQAVTKLMKLRQIISGFIIDTETQTIKNIGYSKIKKLLTILLAKENEQFIVWTQYKKEIEQISKALKHFKITFDIINGDTPDKKRNNILNKFKNNEIRILIAHPKTIGHGVTLTNCNHCVYYSLSYSLEEHKQSRDRIYRYGQEKDVYYYYLLTKKRIDKTIYNILRNKNIKLKNMLEKLKIKIKKEVEND